MRTRLNKPDGKDSVEEGQKDLKRASELSPANVQPLVALADTYERQGNEEKAREIYGKAFGVDATNPRALSNHVYWEIYKSKSRNIIDYV